MKNFWLCLIVSVGLHLVFFQDVLAGMLKTGEAEAQAKKPDRIKIRMVKRKKPKPPEKPKLKRVAVAPKPVIKPKPKLEVRKPKPVVQPKPKPKPVVKPRPLPKPRKVASKPKPIKKPSYPKRKPKFNLNPRSAPKAPKAPPRKSEPTSNKRITRKKSTSKSRAGFATRVPVEDGQRGGKTGVAPDPTGWQPPSSNDGRGIGSPDGDPEGQGGGSSAETPVEPKPVHVPPKPVEAPKPAPPKPKPAPKPKTTPKPKRVATHKAMARKPIISVPNIDPPAKFRREKLQGQLRVRFRVAPDGTFKVSLSDTSGNKEFDDFVLGEIRRTASVQPGLDDEGNPKTSVVRRPVNINID